MSRIKNVLAICGSTRSRSSNLSLIKAIAHLSTDRFAITLFDGLTEISHFNPDIEAVHTPAAVEKFRQAITASDGVLICTPEYAMGVPGTLKNAIDWTVGSMEFSGKPVALITASSSGHKGHAALLDTLQVLEAAVTEDTQLLVSFVKTKVSDQSGITDPATLVALQTLIKAFHTVMENRTTGSLPG